MSVDESAVVAAIVFVAALLQVTLFASLDVAGGVADVLLLSLLSIALLRGAVVGAVAGFFGGLLVDVLTLDTLGVSALLYALAGYWAGPLRRDDRPRPRLRAAADRRSSRRSRSPTSATGSTSCSARSVSARRALFETLLPTLVLNLAPRRPGLRALPVGCSAARPCPTASPR